MQKASLQSSLWLAAMTPDSDKNISSSQSRANCTATDHQRSCSIWTWILCSMTLEMGLFPAGDPCRWLGAHSALSSQPGVVGVSTIEFATTHAILAVVPPSLHFLARIGGARRLVLASLQYDSPSSC